MKPDYNLYFCRSTNTKKYKSPSVVSLCQGFMGRVKAIKIKESGAEMLQLSRKLKHALAQARLRALCGQVQSYDQLGASLSYERHTGKWFQLYREQGLQACLAIDPAGRGR
jgi:hypothetical protein